MTQRAAMPEEIKYSVILAKDSHISNLILQNIHEEVGHGGQNHMQSKLRQKYWVPCVTVPIKKLWPNVLCVGALMPHQDNSKWQICPYKE